MRMSDWSSDGGSSDLIRHTPGGAFSDHFFGAGQTQMKLREILRVEGPFGSFFLREDSQKPLVLVASGPGFAPIKAIVEGMITSGYKRLAVMCGGGGAPAGVHRPELGQPGDTSFPVFLLLQRALV